MKSAGRSLMVGTFVLSLNLSSDAQTPPAPASGAEAAVPAAPKGQSAYARTISTRNGFGLLDPKPVEQPPAVDPTPPPPPVPPSTVQLTGFSRWAGEKKVYLIVTKQGAKAPSYIDLREGEETFDIKAVQIDDVNETAKILNTGIEQTLNFKDNGVKPSSGAPGTGAPNNPNGAPGVPPPPVVNQPRYANAGPTIVGRGGVVNNGAAVSGTPQNTGGGTTFLVDGVPVSNNPGNVNAAYGGTGTANIPAPNISSPATSTSASGTTPRRVFNIPPPPLPPVQ